MKTIIIYNDNENYKKGLKKLFNYVDYHIGIKDCVTRYVETDTITGNVWDEWNNAREDDDFDVYMILCNFSMSETELNQWMYSMVNENTNKNIMFVTSSYLVDEFTIKDKTFREFINA